MYAASPGSIHTVAIDYRGFGSSSGKPSEEGLLVDALTVAEWAMDEAGIPPSRIVIFGQSLGTAVGISLVHHMALLAEPVLFSGMVLVAPFASVEQLTATYRVAGMIPLLDPLAQFPSLMSWFNTFIVSKWPSKDKLAEFVRRVEAMPGKDSKYDISFIHAEDDYDIPWSHSDIIFWHAVNASSHQGITCEDLEARKKEKRKLLGAGGWVATQETAKGVVREEIVPFGLHDKIMSYPVVSLAVFRAFHTK